LRRFKNKPFEKVSKPESKKETRGLFSCNFHRRQWKKLPFHNLRKFKRNQRVVFMQLSSEAMEKVAFP